ncbi:MAG: hypothetical protein JWM41_4567 [Gemmatimonadetes bacterium]|nr:hypothetical protein [Gemmatimonadota bacterium]
MNAVLVPRFQRIRTPLGFIVVALLFYIVDGTLAHSATFGTRPDLFGAAISIDLTLGVTFAYWALVVRPGHATLRTSLPVFALSVVTATLTLPPGQRDLVQFIRYLGIPLEVAVVALVVIGVRRTQQRLAASGVSMDVPERIRASLDDSIMQARLADVVAMEASLMFYALASWRRKPFVPPGAQGFSYHKREAYAATLYVLLFVTIVETVAVHFLVRAFAPRVALGLFAVSAFGAVWLLGFARAVQLRPILLSRTELRIRSGVLWSIDIPRASIERIDFGRVKAPAKGTPGYLRAVPGQPNALVELREPVRAIGLYGSERQITRIGLVIDDLTAFQQTFSAHEE